MSTTTEINHDATINSDTYTFKRQHYVLVVDDEPSILTVTVDALTHAGYHCLTARSANRALQQLNSNDYIFDLMITDVMMKDMNGIDLMKEALQLHPDMPVITMSGTTEVEAPVKALRAGSSDYLIKPFTSEDLIDSVARTLARRITINQQNRITAENAKWTTATDVFALSLDARDRETEGHAERVAVYSLRIAQELRLPHNQLLSIQLGARLHDVGKIAVPDHVLKKPAKLNDEEWIQMKKHPAKGEEMVRRIGLPETSALIVGQHHEQWDGSGYPLGLKETQISIGARVFAVADTFDAITSDRVYRAGQPYEIALEEIRRYSGKQFDPEVVAAFVGIDPTEWITLRNSCLSEKVEQQQAVAC